MRKRKRKVSARALRRLAAALVDEIAEAGAIRPGEREDLVTSLVRQWLTYGGSAILFLGRQQVYLALGQTPLGRRCVVPEPAPDGWVRQLTEEWKVSPEDLPAVIDQLNRGQGAEVVNGDGVPLRLWVNPKERSRGVEPLAEGGTRPGPKRDYCRMAADALAQQFGGGLDPEKVRELARSVAGQWQRYGGHACLFLGGHQQLALKLNEHGDGTYEVVPARTSVDLGRSLSSLGFPPAVLPELIARINLGQEIAFRDGQGAPAVLWHDPKARRICVRKDGPVQPAVPGSTPPILCPECAAVLRPWREGERQQTCSHCGHTILLCPQPAVAGQTPPVLCPTCRAVLKLWREGERQQTCSHCGHTLSLS